MHGTQERPMSMKRRECNKTAFEKYFKYWDTRSLTLLVKELAWKVYRLEHAPKSQPKKAKKCTTKSKKR